jgi:hypothetical protein
VLLHVWVVEVVLVHQVFLRPAQPHPRVLVAVVRELEDDPVDAGGRP